MSNTDKNPLAKTVVHGRPSSEISDADVEQRAREIAVINGRDPERLQPDDLAEARAELLGRADPATTAEDEQSIGTLSRDPSNPPAFHGKAAPNFYEPNEQEELEHLVLDGVEEAQHDQMLEARKRRET